MHKSDCTIIGKLPNEIFLNSSVYTYSFPSGLLSGFSSYSFSLFGIKIVKSIIISTCKLNEYVIFLNLASFGYIYFLVPSFS